MKICVFCGSSPAANPDLLAMARHTGRLLARAGHGIVFGGGSQGMMGALADGVLAGNGKIIGIIPDFLFEREPRHTGVQDMRVVSSMHERKSLMYNLSDVFLTLPGGFGTLDETFEILTWRQLSLHDKPLILMGEKSFWSGLLACFDEMKRQRFITERDRALISFIETPEEVCDVLHDSSGKL